MTDLAAIPITVDTPALIYSEQRLQQTAAAVADLADRAGVALSFTLKPMTLVPMVELIAATVRHLSASSLFEARLARGILAGGAVHMTTPGFRPDEIDAVADLCDYVAFNSLGQWGRFSRRAADRTSCGLRINPHLSLVADERYDPCRKHSKLGTDLRAAADAVAKRPGDFEHLAGLHFHTNCDCTEVEPLLRTVRHIEAQAPRLLDMASWINIGGGYLFGDCDDITPFEQAVSLLRDTHGLRVFAEPGAAVVRDAAWIVSSVIDLFDSDGKTVAVLDTTVNHIPEAFEYQWRPPVVGDAPGAPHEYLLAGCTCLSGDLFGEYAFDEPLAVGSRVVFAEMGSYTAVKWHCFNGVNVPSVYALTADGQCVLKKRFSYEHYLARCGGDGDATA